MIRKLHHAAYRCRDSEQTRRFHEGFLGLPLAGTLEIRQTKSGRATDTLHTFHRLDDGSHIAFEGEAPVRHEMRAKGRAEGVDTRGVSDHGFIESIYLRDPNGYVVELCSKSANHDAAMDPASNGARAKLERGTAARASAAG